MKALRVARHESPRSFLDSAEGWLLEREEENNLVIGIARALADEKTAYKKPIYLATVEWDGKVEGCVFRTPPFKLGLTRLPLEAVPVLADDVGRVFPSIPAVLGPNDIAMAFGEAWAAEKGLDAVPGMQQRIYSVDRIKMPGVLPRGFMRPAVEADRPLVEEWLQGFLTETGMRDHHGADVLARQLVDHGALALWEDGDPVAMAGFSGRTPNTVRVSYVYTPDGQRGRGYASALVAHLSRYLLDGHFNRCVLYTDLANPTSNRIYQRMGYRPVCDVMDVEFRESA